MPSSTIHCPHCKKPVTVATGELATCPACGGDLKVHEVGADEKDEMLKRLLSTVKIVERVDKPEGSARPAEPPAQQKRPWWKFWG